MVPLGPIVAVEHSSSDDDGARRDLFAQWATSAYRAGNPTDELSESVASGAAAAGPPPLEVPLRLPPSAQALNDSPAPPYDVTRAMAVADVPDDPVQRLSAAASAAIAPGADDADGTGDAERLAYATRGLHLCEASLAAQLEARAAALQLQEQRLHSALVHPPVESGRLGSATARHSGAP